MSFKSELKVAVFPDSGDIWQWVIQRALLMRKLRGLLHFTIPTRHSLKDQAEGDGVTPPSLVKRERERPCRHDFIKHFM